MNYVGVDLHKKTIILAVAQIAGRKPKVVGRNRFRCQDTNRIREFFASLGPFQVAVEATASYEWFVQLVEPLAERVVLAHPKKLRIIAESTQKTDKIDAKVLAQFLALEMIPEAYRPTPRQREHRSLTRHRRYIQGRITSVKCKLRNKLADYNADMEGLFGREGRRRLAKIALSKADRFVVNQLVEELDQRTKELAATDKELKRFAKEAPLAEREAREVLQSIPYVGAVTVDVVLSELGDVRRFRSQKQVAAYAGLAPRVRQSAGKTKQLGITKEGSRLLRWALVETAWRMVGGTRRWGAVYERLRQRCGPKKAIVAVARRILCVMTSLLQSGQRYSLALELVRPKA